MELYYLVNDRTGEFAHRESVGEHDGKTTSTLTEAASFEEYSEASEFSQNFGADWRVYE